MCYFASISLSGRASFTPSSAGKNYSPRQETHLRFSLPCGHGLQSAQLRFSFPCGQPLQSAQLFFSFPCEHCFVPMLHPPPSLEEDSLKATPASPSHQLPVRREVCQSRSKLHTSEKGKSHELTKHAPTANGAGRRGTRLHGFAVCENDGKRRENKYDLDSKLCLNRGSRRRRSRRHSRARAAASTEARPAPRVSSRLRPAPPRAGSRHTRASGERSSRLRLSERLNLRSRRAEIHDPRVHPEATPVRPASRRR